jgi:hypothetical protein
MDLDLDLDTDAEAELRDCCPHCRNPFEIVVVRFRTFSTGIVQRCPNCAIVSADPVVTPKLVGALGIIRGIRMIASVNARFRNIIASVIVAVLAAALLRHGMHVYAGVSPEGIRQGAFLGIPAVALLLFVLRKRSVD